MSGNKATYYRLPTKSELNSSSTPQGKPTNTKVLTKDNVVWAIEELRKTHPNFDKLSTSAALNQISGLLKDAGYTRISVTGNTISGPDSKPFYLKKARNNSGWAVRDK